MIKVIDSFAQLNWFALVLWKGSGLCLTVGLNTAGYIGLHSGRGGYPHWLPLGLCCCCCISNSLSSAIWKLKNKFTLSPRSALRETQEEFLQHSFWCCRWRFVYLFWQFKHDIIISKLIVSGCGPHADLSPLNQTDLEHCCSLWLSVSSADVWKCLTGMAGTHQTMKPGEGGGWKHEQWGGSRGCSRRQCAPFSLMQPSYRKYAFNIWVIHTNVWDWIVMTRELPVTVETSVCSCSHAKTYLYKIKSHKWRCKCS